MANNKNTPKTKVDPLDAGLGVEGLKGYDPQNKTQEVKKESKVYTVTKNDGSQVDKSYSQLTPEEKKAINTTGIVSGGKTDIEQKYSVVSGNIGTRPTNEYPAGYGVRAATTPVLTPIAMALGGLKAGGPLGAAFGGVAGGLFGGISFIQAGAQASEQERKFQEAMREYNKKVGENTVIAGDWETDKDGNMIFMPDYSKVGKNINVEESGAKISELFSLDNGAEPDVYFTNDGRLHVDIDRTFADTDEYKGIIDSISSDYAGLTKDTKNVDEYLDIFQQRLSSALNQYRFSINRVASYKNNLPDASVDAIMDAATNEIGAMLADADKKDWTVKVYRDGKIVESNAKDVLDHVYNMKDKYERSDYIETLHDMLQDDSISDDDKAYILSEYNLLFNASNADVKDEGSSEDRKKYSKMLDQDFFVTVLKSSEHILGVDNLVDGIAGVASQGEADDILIANQDYLKPDELASNIGAFVGTAFDIYVSQKIMQGLEQKVVRPLLGSAAKGIGGALISRGGESAAKIGKKMIEAAGQNVLDKAGNVVGYRTTLSLDSLKNSMLNNVIQGFGSETSGLSYRLLAKGAGQFVFWSGGELAINFASDALFDATKLGTAVISGEIDSEDEAAQYMNDALGQDLMMDLIFQYGPQGMFDIHTSLDAARLQSVEPYARNVAEARTKYGDALNAVDAARAAKAAKKEISKLESDVVARKNDLTKAEVEYADAKKQWVGSGSQKMGAKLAEIESRLSENEMYRKFQEAVVDENAAGTALARAAYAASGGDAELFNKLMNTTSNNLRTLTRITANELMADKWAKGTGDSLNAFKQKYSELASYTGKLSKSDIDYIKAKNELIRYTEAAKGDQKQIDAANAFYSKYVDGVGQARATQLDELMNTMRDVVNKTNESAINAGIQTEENIQTKRSATGFQEQGYIPMYLKRKNKSSHYIIPQERNLDRTWDRGEFWDIDNLENPALNTLTYVNYTARNIAVNERNRAIIAASEIPGMRTHRTDADNEIIRTEDGNAYKHSDIVGHMEPKIDKRLNRIEKIKKDAPTELEFSDEKNKILYGKTDGTHDELTDEFRTIVEKNRDNAVGDGIKELASLDEEHVRLEKELSDKEREQDNADVDALFTDVRRFDRLSDLSGTIMDTGTGTRRRKDLFVKDFTQPGGIPGNPHRTPNGSEDVNVANDIWWVLEKAFDDPRVAEHFSKLIDDWGGDKEVAAGSIAQEFYKNLSDIRARDDSSSPERLIGLAIGKTLSGEDLDVLTKYFWRQDRAEFPQIRDRAIRWWNETERLRRRLGIEAYATGYTDYRMVDDGAAYGTREYSFLGPRGEAVVVTPEEIRIAITKFDSLPAMKSTLVHEAAHAAFSRAANRVPLINDALRLLGVDATVSRRVADSDAATELIAYMTQKRFLSDYVDKTPGQLRDIFLDDSVVQKHLNEITKMIGKAPANFKERFIEQVQNVITFVKAKLTASSSLRDVKTLNDFYYGLITGRFAGDMRINNRGQRVSEYQPEGSSRREFGDIELDWSKVPPDVERLALEIIEIQEKIDANTEKQQDLANRIAAAEAEAKNSLRAEVNNRIDALKKYYDDTYSKFGYTTGVRVSQAKIDSLIERNDFGGLATYLEGIKDRASLARPTDQELSDTVFNKQVAGLEIELKRSMNKNFPGLSNEQKRDVYARILGEFRRKAAESGNIAAKQVADETFVRNVGYPITYFENGEEKTAYIDGPLAKPIYEMCVRSENVTDRNFIQKTFEGAAKLKRYATTTIDATRALPNLLRDTLRGDIMSGGTDYAGARKIFAEILDAENLTAEQKAKAMESIELAIKVAQGETLNAAVENRTERGLQDMVRETRQEGKNAVSRIVWDVTHGRIGHALETPMNVAEMYTRRRMAASAYAREFKNAKYTSTSFDERLNKAYDAGINAGMENTTNFSRRGTAVGTIARYVPYFQQNFANIESANNAFLKDPAGVAARAALFSYAYVMMLADTLKKEETRRAYYNLSDYDRKNNIVFSLDGETLVTIPLDESLSSLITPWRRTLETLNNIDPGTFASIFTDTLLDLLPIDLDGFTEGDGLNVRRGMEKIASEVAPSLVTGIIQTITGYNLYYGVDNSVTDASLAERDQVAESAGDYTTTSANSKILRKIADATGIPQWMLQQTVSNFGGNVGQYVLNTLDKLAGASKDEQGGKEFVNAVFKSMTGTDSTNVSNQFYRGIEQLKKDRAKVVNKLQGLNEDISVATGTELADLKQQYQNIKDDYAMKVSNFVDQYLNAYEITGGLDRSQAMQIYYLFNLYDDDTVYEPGSVGAYYQNLAKQQAGNEAASWAAPVLDKYYDQTQDVYKDAQGVWHYSSPYGEKAYYNTLYGQGMKHQVGLRNLIEGVTSELKTARSAAYDARSAAISKGDYELYDKIGADFDARVVKAISPYIKEYGADNVLNNSSVLDYLEEWFFVPSSYMKTKRGRFIPSLAHNASKQRAFVRSYIKSLYGVKTEYNSNERESLLNPEVF